MAKVLLVIGDSRRFLTQAIVFKRLLKHCPTIGVPDLLQTAYMSRTMVRARLAKFLNSIPPGEDCLITYSGHGGKKGWQINDTEFFPYAELARMAAARDGRLLIVNDSCHSASLIEVFDQAGLGEKCGVIASCPKDDRCGPGLVELVVKSWATRQVYRPEPLRAETYVINSIEHREIALNRWKYAWRRLLDTLTLGLVPRVPLHVLIGDKSDRPTEVVTATLLDPSRWGLELDEAFFPPP